MAARKKGLRKFMKSRAAKIRASLDHPVVDADGHMLEYAPVFLDFLKQVAGADTVKRYVSHSKNARANQWHKMSRKQVSDHRISRPPFWAVAAAHTRDRATSMLPGLLRDRLDEFGFDYTIVYPTFGFFLIDEPDEELRRACCRAHNSMTADIFGPHADRMTPAACIPTGTPAEAIEELEYAVNTLDLKVAMVASLFHRPTKAAPRVEDDPRLQAYWIDNLAVDSEYDYDPFWAKCVELGIAPTAHSHIQGHGHRRSVNNYLYNQIGHFADAGEASAKAMFFGGVTRRFPELNFGFLEGGVSWACSLYATLVSAWKKRGAHAIRQFDPSQIDFDTLGEYFDKYGGESFARALSGRATNETKRLGYVNVSSDGTTNKADLALLDDFAACQIEKAEDIVDLFIEPFYFGCEADDPMAAVAFRGKGLPFDVKLKAVFGSDIGHWDVPEMREVLEEAYELVEDGLINEDDFRDFTFTNPVMLHARGNPNFFKGTVVEDSVDKLLKAEAKASKVRKSKKKNEKRVAQTA